MKRVLFWSESFWPYIGGVEVLGEHLLLALQRRGYRFAVVTQRHAPTHPALEQYRDIPIHRFPFSEVIVSKDLRRVRDLRAQVLELKRAFRPDLVLVYYTAAEGFFQLHTSAAAPAPLLVTLHGAHPAEELARSTGRGELLRTADWVATCSRAVRDHLVAHIPEIAPRTSAIPNALEVPTLRPAPLSFDPPRLLCIGRQTAEKGFDVALAAFPSVLARFPHARLVLAGDGRCHAALLAQAAALSLGAVVEFLDPVHPSRVPALINSATALLVPSRSYEGFSLVALQAAQMGRPVVATRIGGLPEVVEDGRTGALVAPDDPAALARAIISILEAPDRAARMGAAAAARARTQFRWEDHVDAYDALIRRLI